MDPQDPPFESQPGTARPLPWEDSEAFPGFWDRVAGTFRLAFTAPMTFFERVPRTEGLGRPWTFLLFTSLPSYLLLLVILLIAGLVLSILGLADAKENLFRQYPALAWILPLVLGGLLVLLPLLQFLGMVLLGGLQHFFLWMFGGTRDGLGAQQTIRACTYAWAIIGLVCFLPSLIPYLGILIVLPLKIAGMVFTGMGLARLHRTETWRGIAAVFAPVVLLCCCVLALWFGLITSVLIPNALKASQRAQVGQTSADASVAANVELTRQTLERESQVNPVAVLVP